MSLPANNGDHVCSNCGKTRVSDLIITQIDDSVFICKRKRLVKEGYCTAWIGKTNNFQSNGVI